MYFSPTQGVATALGAAGSSKGSLQRTENRHGGPGSIFIRETRNQLPYYSLLIDGNNLDVFKYVSLTEADRLITAEYDQLSIFRKGALRMEPNGSGNQRALSILRFTGDKTGLIRVYDSHRVTLGVDKNGVAVGASASSNSSNNAFARPFVNFIVQSGGEIILRRRFLVSGAGVSLINDPESDQSLFGFDHFAKVAFMDDGRMTNVDHFHVGKDTNAVVGSNAHSAVLEKGDYVMIGKPGQFRFGSVDLYTGATMR